ncbi:DNA cytosine methyltransferase [Bacillus cereus]
MFTDEFVFVAGNIAGKYKVIGNAVPPKLDYVIAKQIIDILDGKIETEDDTFEQNTADELLGIK